MSVLKFRVSRLLCSAALSLMAGVPAALAYEFIISSPVSITNGGNTLDGGDTLTITNQGAINLTSGGKNAVTATGASNTIIHHGEITTTRGGSKGIYMDVGGNGDATILGVGDITTLGGNSTAVRLLLDDGNATVNAGNVSASGGRIQRCSC